MTAATWNITIEQGSDYAQPFVYAGTDGTPVDLTGCTAAMMIRRAYDAPTPLVSLTTGDGITVDGPSGTVSVFIPQAAVDALPVGAAVYDLVLTDPLGKHHRFLQGTATISPAITHD